MFRNIRQIMRLDVIAARQGAFKADIDRLTERMEQTQRALETLEKREGSRAALFDRIEPAEKRVSELAQRSQHMDDRFRDLEANYAELRRDYLDLRQSLESSHQDENREERIDIAITKMNREIQLHSEELRKTAAALMNRISAVKAAPARSES